MPLVPASATDAIRVLTRWFVEIPAKDVYEVLKEKGVETINHANSVITACQFLRMGALLSRGTCERKGLYQTPQQSDLIDKRQSIWFDVFCDTVDIHHRAKRKNVYGPVLFVLDSEIIEKAYTGKVWVTKLNPTKWTGRKHKDRWFLSKEDLQQNLKKGQFDQMIVFRHCGGELPLDGYLKKIILDDPKKKSITQIEFFSMAYGALTLAKTEGGIACSINKRQCPDGCTCIESYKADHKHAVSMFFPRP